MKACIAAAVLLFLLPARGDVVTRLPTNERVLALTFDACERHETMKLDTGISDYLVTHRIPFTVFLSGRFAADNAEAVKKLAALPFVELENHSWDHPNQMPSLADDDVRAEVLKTDAEVARLTGRGTAFFRFPALHYDARTLALVEALGFTVVHYRWEAGDPDPRETADRIVAETLEAVRPGDILIHHINGRGWHTAEALPRLIPALRDKGYRFVLLRDYLKDKRSRAVNAPAPSSPSTPSR